MQPDRKFIKYVRIRQSYQEHSFCLPFYKRYFIQVFNILKMLIKYDV